MTVRRSPHVPPPTGQNGLRFRARLIAPTLAGLFALSVVTSGVALGASPTTAAAQSTPGTAPVTVPATDVPATTAQRQLAPVPHIIPQPNSGHKPRDPGDRGGWWQEALFFLMCGAVLGMGALVWRDSRKQRRRQGRPPGRPSTPRPATPASSTGS